MANTLFTQFQNAQNGASKHTEYDNAIRYCKDRGFTPKEAVLDLCKQRGVDVNNLLNMFNR